uniref:PPM-type phosphatase domain-containing protein n=1 Tax=Fibrocapsa japonica TaxID=94617 RepID=A0A7S2XYL2_9STRA|mmetsp:Transcript_23011/g.33391  ORF Transcript_23011/g.33391 Transcript_23011/m.33391 type:complete len:224 (+) Transcript_23011:3-674(+)
MVRSRRNSSTISTPRPQKSVAAPPVDMNGGATNGGLTNGGAITADGIVEANGDRPNVGSSSPSNGEQRQRRSSMSVTFTSERRNSFCESYMATDKRGSFSIQHVANSSPLNNGVDPQFFKPPQQRSVSSSPLSFKGCFCSKVPRTGSPAFLLLASDGVWDVLSFKQAAVVVHKELIRNAIREGIVSAPLGTEDAPANPAEILANKSAAVGSTDDISAIVVCFE